ncbi:MAG: hypothetical protein AMJ61_16010 [Desulfobacterales bacterium SG8_35_2]|nr:MAG: hypothetical protein AMJ61_16010 [Desulfobacterales bacterium SG8_35_2]
MKKLLIPLLLFFTVFFSLSNADARTYWRTFLVDEVTSQGIILRDFEGNRFLVDKRYDTVKNKMKIHPWQPARITEIGNNSITLMLHNGETAEVNMKRGYREQFKKGDLVEYKASKGQIKKSHLQPVE